MTTTPHSQAGFAHALLSPQAPVPEGLTDPEGRPTTKRFAVYRNNVAASLTEALEQAFPAIQSLIGDTRFKALAGLYLRAHPPSDPRLMLYGNGMADFLPSVAPLARYPYLADVARLEQALRESYHAADQAPFDPARLAALAPDRLASARVVFAPATRIIQSVYPAMSIRARALDSAAPAPAPVAETVLITRPALDPQLSLIPPALCAPLIALWQGAPLGTLGDTAADLLPLILKSGALCDIESETTP